MKCPMCEGCGKIANDNDRSPWLYWENLPPGSDLAVRLGVIRPILCPHCSGRGTVPEPSGESQCRSTP